MDFIMLSLGLSAIALLMAILIAAGVIPASVPGLRKDSNGDLVRPADLLKKTDIDKYNQYGSRLQALESRPTPSIAGLDLAKLKEIQKHSATLANMARSSAHYVRSDKQYEINDASGKYTLMTKGFDADFDLQRSDGAEWGLIKDLGKKAHLQVKFVPFPT